MLMYPAILVGTNNPEEDAHKITGSHRRYIE